MFCSLPSPFAVCHTSINGQCWCVSEIITLSQGPLRHFFKFDNSMFTSHAVQSCRKRHCEIPFDETFEPMYAARWCRLGILHELNEVSNHFGFSCLCSSLTVLPRQDLMPGWLWVSYREPALGHAPINAFIHALTFAPTMREFMREL